MIDFTGLEVRRRYCDEPFDGDELDPNGGGYWCGYCDGYNF